MRIDPSMMSHHRWMWDLQGQDLHPEAAASPSKKNKSKNNNEKNTERNLLKESDADCSATSLPTSLVPELPPEIWEACFPFAQPSDLPSLRATCRSWQSKLDEVAHECLWEAAYQAEWPARGAGNWKSEASVNLWRLRFLTRWGPHARWCHRSPTVCTLMGKKAHNGTVTCIALGDVAMDTGECSAVSASDDGAVFLWRFSRTAGGHQLPNGVAQQHHRQCQGVDVRCPSRAKQFYGHAGPVWSLCYRPEASLLLSGGYDATIKSWSLHGERCEATLRGHDGWVTAMQCMQHRPRLISGSSDGMLKIWSLEDFRCTHTAQPPNSSTRHSTNGMALLEGHNSIVCAHSGMQELLQSDLETMVPVAIHQGHTQDIYSVHAEEGSRMLVSGSKDRTVRIWDARTPQAPAVAMLAAHTGAVLAVKCRGQRVVSASMDKTVRLWDLRSIHAPLSTMEGHSAEVHSVDFHDRMILSGSRDTSVKVWTVV
mmetsp:Transcript_73987/g.154245  ORF Transcript_73987/g.154245 Transcript_73987/m.154245 type:complete len:483 (-) Transcript_73987:387-1835(-)